MRTKARKARDRADAEKCARIVELRRRCGHSCADCTHLDWRFVQGLTCALGDDGPWYQPTTPDNLCWQWEAKP